MIHIVFNEADVEVMKEAISLDESLAGEVIQIKDDYAVGPLKDIYSEEGIEARKNWWREVLSGGDYHGLVDKGIVDDNKAMAELKEKLNHSEELMWIWAAQNKHDASGYYWMVSQLKEFHGQIFILYLNNLPFINEKGGVFYPRWINDIPAKEFLKAKKLARPVTLSEFEVDPDEWKKLCEEDKGVRILEGGKKLEQYDYDFYDGDLKKFITNDWQKASRIIHHFLHKNTHTTGDAYLLWRLKTILAEGEFEVQGEIKGMKDFEVKRKSPQEAQV
jgi:hypothetical protein